MAAFGAIGLKGGGKERTALKRGQLPDGYRVLLQAKELIEAVGGLQGGRGERGQLPDGSRALL